MTKIHRRAAAAALAAAGQGAAIVAAQQRPGPPPDNHLHRAGNSDHTFNLGSGHSFTVGDVELFDNLIQGSKQIGHDGESYTVMRLGSRSADRWTPPSRCSPTARSPGRPGHLKARVREPSSSRSPAAPAGTGRPRLCDHRARQWPRKSPSTSPRNRQSNRPRPAGRAQARPARISGEPAFGQEGSVPTR